MSDPILNDPADVCGTTFSELFTFQKMLAVTNSLVPVTKPPSNDSKIIAVVLSHLGHLHTPRCTGDKEKAVSETAEKYSETAPTFSGYWFGSIAW